MPEEEDGERSRSEKEEKLKVDELQKKKRYLDKYMGTEYRWV